MKITKEQLKRIIQEEIQSGNNTWNDTQGYGDDTNLCDEIATTFLQGNIEHAVALIANAFEDGPKDFVTLLFDTMDAISQISPNNMSDVIQFKRTLVANL
jgi:hypothetical protein